MKAKCVNGLVDQHLHTDCNVILKPNVNIGLPRSMSTSSRLDHATLLRLTLQETLVTTTHPTQLQIETIIWETTYSLYLEHGGPFLIRYNEYVGLHRLFTHAYQFDQPGICLYDNTKSLSTALQLSIGATNKHS